MSVSPLDRLAALAKSDPTVAPLVALQLSAFHAAVAPFWADSIPFLQRDRLDAGAPLLHHARLQVDAERLLSLLRELAAVAEQQQVPHVAALRDALGGGVRRAPSRLDPLALLQASLVGDEPTLEALAGGAGVEMPLLVTIAAVASLPLLQTIGREAAPLVRETQWDAGFCPICAAWPLLAELRGLERRRWLRCGRCGSGWAFPHSGCSFCDNRDHRTLGYLAAEGQHESQQAATCERCHNYLKSFATISPLGPEEVVTRDLSTVELDVAALEQGYGRPAALGFPLEVAVVALERRFGWLPWGR